MFNIFKKKAIQESQAIPAAEGTLEKKLSRDISDVEIYVMPEKLNSPKQDTSNRKKWFLILGISMSILAVSVLLFFLFKDKIFNIGNITSLPDLPSWINEKNISEPNTVATSTANKPIKEQGSPENAATGSPEIIATGTPEAAGTTTPEIIGTTTPEIANSTSLLAATTTPIIDLSTTTMQVLDSDKDGLSDLEEEIFSSDKFNMDTDGDGYLDGVEITNLYDPTIYSNGKLINGVAVKVYEENRYSLIYPKSWKTDVAEEGKVLFKAQNGEFVELIISPNLEGISTLDWYNSQSGGNKKLQNPEEVSAKSRLKGLKINDNVIYLNDYNYIYILTYNNAMVTAGNYSKVFEMIWNSSNSKIDTDGDGKLDYLEVSEYHTDPKKLD